MTVARGVGSVLLSALGIFIVVLTVVVVAGVLGSDAPVKPIILKSIELRSADDSLTKANLISDLDDMVAQADNQDIKDQWDRMMGCLATNCPDEAYLDMVLVTVAAYENELPESALLINIIAAGKYWNDPEHLLDFSRALSIANDQVDELESKQARKQWQAIIDCNGTCQEKNTLFFELIQTIIS
ncbi:hypothetical protein HY489_03765 [Candidatus Woesearchaeota archaeon]|nr:hypothetical protein [Candidatus Woesearchaeota archaeon]